jgi:hypothetical protein
MMMIITKIITVLIVIMEYSFTSSSHKGRQVSNDMDNALDLNAVTFPIQSMI